MLKGIGASEGIGIGKVMIIEDNSLEYTPKTVSDTDAELKRFRDAVDAFCDETMEQAEAVKKSAGEKEAEILMGHIYMMKDPGMVGSMEAQITAGQCAEAALEQVCDMFI